MAEQCDCKAATQLLLDVRASLREEEAAADEYLVRGLLLQEHDPRSKIYEHIRMEELTHYKELAELEEILVSAFAECECQALQQILSTYPIECRGNGDGDGKVPLGETWLKP